MPHAAINGQNIYFEDSGGDGAPVILAHGFLMDHEMFAPQVEALTAAGYRVITWDERGFGLTEFDDQPFTYWDSASDCLGVLDHLAIDQAVVGGMSQGGFLSLRTALSAPDRVRALILIDTQAGAEDPALIDGYTEMKNVWLAAGPVPELAGTIADIIISEPATNELWIAKWQQRPKELLEQPFNCLIERDDISSRLGEITCPALVIHGIDDQAISIDRGEQLAAGLVGATGVVKVAGAHAPNLTNPAPVNEAILRFLNGL
jgi:pimeloyl-ACP methyl ester carboxylesterase